MWMYKGRGREGKIWKGTGRDKTDLWCYLIFLVLLLFDTITSEVSRTRHYWCITIFIFFLFPTAASS